MINTRFSLSAALLCTFVLSATAAPASKYDVALKERLAANAGGTFQVMVALAPRDRAQYAPADLVARRSSVRAAGDRVLTALGGHNVRVDHRWQAVAGLVLTVDAKAVAVLAAQPEVRMIGADLGAGSGNLSDARSLTGLDATAALGFTGAGTRIAVLDSGYDTDHLDLVSSLIGEKCFAEGGTACPFGPDSAEDDFGHGSAVSGVITGDGNVAPAGGAVDTEIYAVKVLDDNNGFSSTAFVVDGLDFLINSGIEFDAVNMSLGTFASFTSDCDDSAAFTIALADAVDTLRALGTLSIVSSGNQGITDAIQAPACASGAVGVGAVNDGGTQLFDPFGCGAPGPADSPTCYTNASVSLDLVAPGSEMTTDHVGGGFAFWHGTSFAAPTVAACVAVLREAEPTLTPDQLVAVLLGSTSVNVTIGANSFGRLDCAAALAALDGDSDGVPDSVDNCPLVANESQRDTDADLIGNPCDPDLNNDCIVNPTDLGFFRSVFLSDDPDADFNGDGVVNPADLGVLRLFFLGPPGPGGHGNACATR